MHRNTHTANLTLPDGTLVLPGKVVEIPTEDLENPAVKGWIANGMLVLAPEAEPEEGPETVATVTDVTAETEPAPETELSRSDRLRELANNLADDDKLGSGMPKLEALNALLGDGEERVTKEERNRVFGQ